MAGPSSVGINVFAGEPPVPEAGTGRVFWVGATATVPGGVAGTDNAGAFGSTPHKPFATVDYALGQCTDNQGDVIYLLPQHQEDVADATTFQIDKIGVSIIGLGRGEDRPTFNFTNAAGTVEVDAANCRLSNVILRADVTAVLIGVDVDGHDFEMDHVLMDYNQGSVDDYLQFMDIDAVNRAYIHDNVMHADATVAGPSEAIRLDTANFVRIEDNIIMGDFSRAAIMNEGAASLQVVVARNTIYNSDTAAAENGIDFTQANTGIIAYNNIGSLSGTTVTDIIDPGSCMTIENYCSNAIDETGVIIPVATSS